MSNFTKSITESRVYRSIVRHGFPDSNRNRALMVMSNFFLHIHPVKVRLRAIAFRRTYYLGGLSAEPPVRRPVTIPSTVLQEPPLVLAPRHRGRLRRHRPLGASPLIGAARAPGCARSTEPRACGTAARVEARPGISAPKECLTRHQRWD